MIIDQGKGTLKGLSYQLPTRLRYWTVIRMVRSGQWDAQQLLSEMVGQVLPWLPAPADGVLYLLVDSTLKQKRGHKHPLGRKTRMNEYAAYIFGFEMVLLVACWNHYRIPVALAIIDPQVKGHHNLLHQNLLFRQMLQAFEPPHWARRVVVLGDAGFAANKTLAVIEEKGYCYVFGMPRTRKFSDGKHLSDLVRHLPKSHYRRVASYKSDGRRRDYWVYARRAKLHNVGHVTLVLSKRRRNQGPQQTKIIVTNLPTDEATKAGAILSCYARRWDIEVTFKELKGGLPWGQMQVTKDKARVERSVVLPVLAYLLLLRLYGRSAASRQEVSLFHLKQRFTADVWQEQWLRSEQRWGKKLDQLKLAA